MDWPTSDSHAPLGDGRSASAVDRPTTPEELRDAVRRRVADGLAIYPQGGRTALDYGGVPRRPGVAVDVTGLDRVIDYPAADMTITVEAGITLEELARVLGAEGQRLEIDAPQPDRATIGGVFATNTTGPRRFGWGRPKDQVIGIGFVSGNGDLVKGGGRVVKNVAGYDFPKLLTGSLGTLGVIAHVTVKVRPKPEASAIVRVAYDGLDAVAHDLDRLNTSSTRPVALELANDPAGAWSLAVGFEGNAAEVAWQVGRLGAELSGSVVETIEGGATVPAWAALREFPAGPGAVSVVANVRPSDVARFASTIDAGLWSTQAHAGNGVVRLRSRVEDLGAIEADVRRLRALAEGGEGNLVVARCPSDRKESLGVWGSPRPDWAWMERVKAALDPGWVMNPGRFVGTI